MRFMSWHRILQRPVRTSLISLLGGLAVIAPPVLDSTLPLMCPFPPDVIVKSKVVQAREILLDEGYKFDLVLVTEDSTDVRGEIYRDLIARNIRATTGPDEGIDVRSEMCYPQCMFVPKAESDVLTVETWVLVLRHEYRHIEQAKHNPNMARDFRDADGTFTPYAAFSEACADYGLNVGPYFAQERIDVLKAVIPEHWAMLDRACEGDKTYFDSLVAEYNRRRFYDNAFRDLFPPYR